MFLIDDLLLFPIKGILAVFREIHKATEQDAANEEDAIRTKLSDLYMLLETGGLAEDEFDQQEKELLDRLDEIEAIRTLPKNEDDENDDDENDDDDHNDDDHNDDDHNDDEGEEDDSEEVDEGEVVVEDQVRRN